MPTTRPQSNHIPAKTIRPILSAFASLVLLASCAEHKSIGTSPILAGAVDVIGPQMCARLVTCFAGDQTNCLVRIGQANGITQALGLNTTTYPNLDTVTNAIFLRNLQTTANLATCKSAIQSLACSNPIVTSSFSNAHPNGFNDAFNLLSASSSCQSAITP